MINNVSRCKCDACPTEAEVEGYCQTPATWATIYGNAERALHICEVCWAALVNHRVVSAALRTVGVKS